MVDKVDHSLSLYLVAFIVIVPDSFFHVYFVFYYNLGDVITQLLHCPGSHFYISLRTVSAHASWRFSRSSGYENSLLLHFCEISHWAGPNQLFLFCVSRGLFLYTVCENVFISLDYYNGF